ncbi:MAG: endolytic transglycosylase MltG [Pseudomonadota bacterium]
MSWRSWTASSFLAVTCLLVALAIGLFVRHFSQPGPLSQPRTVIISQGQTLPKISKLLTQHGVLTNSMLFSWHVRLRGAAQKLQAGEYQFASHITPEQILNALILGKTVKHNFTVPEGMTTFQILDKLNQQELLSGECSIPIAEGEILPETYSFYLGETRNKLLERMRQAMTETLQKLWINRDPGLPLQSAQDALILASIVEKEAKLAQERPRIAAVFLNRLKKDMQLQADPTVIYGLNLERNQPTQQLTKKDLTHASPYNTYMRADLPPTPICNPGYASIHAVLHPSKTDELYFVADGTGGHVFSKTYQAHKQHHQNWRKVRRSLDL